MVALASCGDYLEHSPVSDQLPRFAASELTVELRLPWLKDRPCDGPGCKKSSDTFSQPVAVTSARQLTPPGIALSTVSACQQGRERICWKSKDCDLETAFGNEIFRPPASSRE